MTLRRRLIPVAALVVAIGASAAGAATAAETGSGTTAGGTDKGQKPVNCKVLLPGGGVVKKDPGLGKGKPVKVVSLDTIASELGVTKTALVQALTQTKQWIAASTAKPSAGAFARHLADLLHVPVAKVASVFGSELHIAASPGA